MSTQKIEVVKSVAGHDSGKLYCVISRDEGFALIVNGKTRKLDNPKRKKEKHLEPMNIEFTEETDRRQRDAPAIEKTLSQYAKEEKNAA